MYCIYLIRPKKALKTPVIYTKKWPKCLSSPLVLHDLFSLSLHLWPHEEAPIICWQKRWSVGMNNCFSLGHTLKDSGRRENLSVNRMSSKAPGYSLCLQREMAQCATVYWFMACGQWLDWVVRDFERTWLENWWQVSLGKGYMEWAKTWRYLCTT